MDELGLEPRSCVIGSHLIAVIVGSQLIAAIISQLIAVMGIAVIGIQPIAANQ